MKSTTALATALTTSFGATPGAVLALLLGTLVPVRVGAAPPPGAHELLARVEAVYRSLSSYADTGTLEVLAPGEPGRRFVFETRWSAASEGREETFLLRLDRVPAAGSQTPWKVLWRAPSGEARHWDAERNQVKTAPSLAAELAHHLPADAGWPGGRDALPVPALLVGLDVLRDPDAAALEGEEECRAGGAGGGGGPRCRVVALSRLNGSVALWLWVEEGSGWIHRAEVELRDPAGLGAAEPWRLRWEIDPRPASGDGVPAAAFEPPADARPVRTWERLEERAETRGDKRGEPGGDRQPEAVFGEVIEVGLTTVRVRVVDRAGRPIRGLSAEDFRVTVRPDRKAKDQGGGSGGPVEVPVVAVDWVTTASSSRPDGGEGERRRRSPTGLPADEPWTDPFAADAPVPGTGPGFQRVLLFIQSGIHALRTRGHLRFLPWVRDLLEELPPGDPVAVVGYDSHLKLWQDFTLDREAVYDAVYGAIHFSGRPTVPRASERGPLYEHLDFEAAKKAAQPEEGLEVAARALVPLPGPKTVIWLGWGLGRLASRRVGPKPEYRPALRALEAAQATVFVIDVTDAAYHDLEFGLKQVAADTGGTYAKAHERPDALIRNLTAAASGHYLLHLDRAGLPRYPGELEVELVAAAKKEAGSVGVRVLLPASRWVP